MLRFFSRYKQSFELRYLVIDVDGTLTDGKIHMNSNGEIFKTFNVKDGCGIRDILIPKDIIPIVISGRESEIVSKRCDEIGITNVYLGVTDKCEKLLSVIDDFSTIAYIGDDINDLECMKKVKKSGGVVGCPKDAAPQVIKTANYVAKSNGGDGAVRDFIEWIVRGYKWINY